MRIENVAILGGNGTVGSLMGALIAGFGKATVYLISRDKNKLNEKLLDKMYASIKSDSIKNRIITCDYSDAENVLGECDWIFESVAESYDIKESVYKSVNKFAKKNAIITTGTSGLSINELAKSLDVNRKANFFCTHFFNPPYNMTLCELIPNEYTDELIMKEFRKYLQEILIRTTIISKDTPAFIANRIGFKLMNDLLLLADKYKDKGGINYIDSLFTGYTGRNMKPFETIDFVGLDIHKAIVDNIYAKTNDEFKQSFKLPEWFETQIKNGFLGNKTKKGLYEGKDLVFDINSHSYINKQKYKLEEIIQINELIKEGEYIKAYQKLFKCDTEEKKIVTKTLIQYIVYAIYIGKNTAEKIEDCDDAMATGFGWCPPIALKELIDEVNDFKKLCDNYIGKNIMDKYQLYETIEQLPKSKYDYRKYIKAV